MSDFELVALDAEGGQAVAKVSGEWFIASIDSGWSLDPASVHTAWRCILFGHCKPVHESFSSRQALQQGIRALCQLRMLRPSTTYDDVRHLDPSPRRKREPLAAGVDRDLSAALFGESRLPAAELVVEIYLALRRYAHVEAKRYRNLDPEDLASESLQALLRSYPFYWTGQPPFGWAKSRWFSPLQWRIWRERERESFARWFVHRTAKRLVEKTYDRDLPESEIEPLPAPGLDPEELAAASEHAEQVRAALGQLLPKEQAALQLLSEGKTYTEVAEALHLSHREVRRLLMSARQHLLELLRVARRR